MQYKAMKRDRDPNKWSSARIETSGLVVIEASPAWRGLVGRDITHALYTFKERGMDVWVRATERGPWTKIDLSNW